MLPAPRRIQRFEVIDHLGSGGMGTVYRARDPQLERDVAIKVLATRQPPEELADGVTLDLRTSAPSNADDLLNEARMMARLSHQNVLPVYEVGLAEGSLFLVMEHIDGTDLATWLERERTTREVLDVFAQAARGLYAAHQRGIVHRDVKPANILIGHDGRVRVADFGLSRLAARGIATAMVRIDDGLGTPRYMAPELWRGEAATPKSDVYALCFALLEALGAGDPHTRASVLRERGVAPRLRAMACDGVAEDPAARPELAALIAALEGRGVRPRSWVIAALAVVAAALGTAAVLALDTGGGASCDGDDALFEGRYDTLRRASVIAALRPLEPAAAKEILGGFDEYRAAVDEQARATCRAAHASQIGEAQRQQRMACLTRRALELGATVERQVTAAPALRASFSRVQALSPIGDCADMQAPPLAGDARAVEALWKRFEASEALAVPDKSHAHIAELREIEKLAEQLGERELSGRAQLWRGVEHRFSDEMQQADLAFQGAQKIALELHATGLAIRAVYERSTAAALADATAARNYANLARDLAEKPGGRPLEKARALAALGLAASSGGDYKEAAARLREGLALLMATGRHYPSVELDMRYGLAAALTNANARLPELIALARENVQRVKEMYGDKEPNYGVALNLLAGALHNAHDYAAALPYRRQALDLMHATMPADSSVILAQSSDYAMELRAVGRIQEARDVWHGVVEGARRSERLKHDLPDIVAMYAAAVFDTGDHVQGLALAQQALEDGVSEHKKEHPYTYQSRLLVATMALEVGKLDLAARELESLEHSYRARGADMARELLRLEGAWRAQLALARGAAREAEARARAGLARVRELPGDPEDEARMLHVLARSLVAQRRYADARDAVAKSRELLAGTQARADVLAGCDVTLARAEAGLGLTAEARERAQRARAVLERYPGQIVARREADALLGVK